MIQVWCETFELIFFGQESIHTQEKIKSINHLLLIIMLYKQTSSK